MYLYSYFNFCIAHLSFDSVHAMHHSQEIWMLQDSEKVSDITRVPATFSWGVGQRKLFSHILKIIVTLGCFSQYPLILHSNNNVPNFISHWTFRCSYPSSPQCTKSHITHIFIFLRYFHKRVCLKDYLCFPFMPIYDWVYFNNENWRFTKYKLYCAIKKCN